jgi:hypothetical protein
MNPNHIVTQSADWLNHVTDNITNFAYKALLAGADEVVIMLAINRALTDWVSTFADQSIRESLIATAIRDARERLNTTIQSN